jgi:hypothetical protein
MQSPTLTNVTFPQPPVVFPLNEEAEQKFPVEYGLVVQSLEAEPEIEKPIKTELFI